MQIVTIFCQNMQMLSHQWIIYIFLPFRFKEEKFERRFYDFTYVYIFLVDGIFFLSICVGRWN